MKTRTLIAGLCMLAGIVSCTGTSNTKCGATNEETSQELGKMETHVYEGLLPAASGRE